MTEEQKEVYTKMDKYTLVDTLLEQQTKVNLIRAMRDSYKDNIEQWQKYHDQLYAESKLLIDLKYVVIARISGINL